MLGADSGPGVVSLTRSSCHVARLRPRSSARRSRSGGIARESAGIAPGLIGTRWSQAARWAWSRADQRAAGAVCRGRRTPVTGAGVGAGSYAARACARARGRPCSGRRRPRRWPGRPSRPAATQSLRCALSSAWPQLGGGRVRSARRRGSARTPASSLGGARQALQHGGLEVRGLVVQGALDVAGQAGVPAHLQRGDQGELVGEGLGDAGRASVGSTPSRRASAASTTARRTSARRWWAASAGHGLTVCSLSHTVGTYSEYVGHTHGMQRAYSTVLRPLAR